MSHIYLKCNNFTDLPYLHEENLNKWSVACSQVKPMQLLRNQHGFPDGIGWSFSLSLLLRRCRLFKNWCGWDWVWNSWASVDQRQTLEPQHVRCDSKPWLVMIRTGLYHLSSVIRMIVVHVGIPVNRVITLPQGFQHYSNHPVQALTLSQFWLGHLIVDDWTWPNFHDRLDAIRVFLDPDTLCSKFTT